MENELHYTIQARRPSQGRAGGWPSNSTDAHGRSRLADRLVVSRFVHAPAYGTVEQRVTWLVLCMVSDAYAYVVERSNLSQAN